MKHIALTLLAISTVILVSCDEQKAAVEANKDATKKSIDHQKDAVDAAAKNATKQADANASINKANIEANKDAAQAQLDANKKKADAEAAAEKARLQRLHTFTSDGNGYFQIQATRPQTLSYALTDSPAGQLAWITEKFKEWTYPSTALPETAIDRARLLTNVMIYWLTGTAGSSARLYYETMHAGSWGQPPATTPTGVAVFAEDVAIRRYAERGHNIVHWSEFDRGGHFAAMEAPDLLVGDVRTFFRRFR